MPEANINDIIIEKTPAYFTANPLVPERVFNFNSKLKFILILRSPIIRTISDFTQILQTKKEKNKTTINLEKMSLIKINNSIKLNKRPIRNSLYFEHLIRWLKYFPLKQFLILDGEKFIKDPLSQLKIVEQFLNLKPLINSNQLIFNFQKKFFVFVKI
ncbi:Sulfotransfer_1 domain-containing protein [Meloidogyne graminicola]|uniref:Sulfotransfer_1 domain-containing protein n=1 Tax=Meloidogyne graminicola TaxID=189291 RepID=A0A8S9ZM56_9BILA|nr:Sulfotransfer_1 domain-containing protein [Meloidogyne graminicola]